MYLDNIKNYQTKIYFLTGDSINISNGKAESLFFMPGEIKKFASDSILSISLNMERNGIYNYNIYTKPIPYKRFKNL